MAAGAAGGGAPYGLVDPVEAGLPRRRRRPGRAELAASRLRRYSGVLLRGPISSEERVDGARGSPVTAGLAGERREAVHEAGEVDGGGLGLEDGVREQEVDGARLQRLVGPERGPARLQQVGRRAQHVSRGRRGRRRSEGGGGARDGDGGAVGGEVLHVAVGVDHPHPRVRPQRARGRRRRREGAPHGCAEALAPESGGWRITEMRALSICRSGL